MMKLMKSCHCLVALVLAMFVNIGIAAEQAPDALLREVTDDVLEIIRTDKDLKGGDARRAVELVEKHVLPNFNFSHMTQLALGKEWRQTSAEQKRLLTDEFRKLLVRTYSKALTQYKNQTVFFKPFEMKPGLVDAKVRTEIRQPGAKAISLDYYVEKLDGNWKVYDIEVEGISLVTNYRETFTSEIRQSGVDGLIASLKEKNGSGTTAVAKTGKQ
jgi:phospholipid transport system substrate-binding protein